jgi:hypothetical protein
MLSAGPSSPAARALRLQHQAIKKMKIPVRRLANLLFVLFFAAISGCGEEGAHLEKVVPVSGTLTFQGQPLEHYQVTFLPSDGRRAAVGLTDAAGKFTMGTNAKDDGAPPGSHKVAFVFVGPQSDDTSTQVPIDDPALMPQPKIKIPDKYANPDTSGYTQNVPDEGIQDLKIDLK